MKRKLTMRAIQSVTTKEGKIEDRLVQEKELEIDGALRCRVFNIDIGNMPPADAQRFIQSVRDHLKNTKGDPNPLEMEEDFFIPMRNGVPQVEIEFWEEVEETEE